MREQIQHLRAVYDTREPAGTDTWNPVFNEIELWHRVRLLLEATYAFKMLQKNLKTLTVLDVGAGVGRSSRLLVELGVMPHNIVSIDLRADALIHAKKLNPAINTRALHGLEDWPKEKFDLCIQCTAFSSIPGEQLRQNTAKLMQQSLVPNGYIFWWDCLSGNDFAGGGQLVPEKLFGTNKALYRREVSLYPSFTEAALSLPRARRYMQKLLGWIPTNKTHLCALYGAGKE